MNPPACVQAGAILNAPLHAFRETGHKAITLVVFQDLSLIFQDEPTAVDINDLTSLMAHLLIRDPLGQGAPINLQLGYHIGIIHRF